MTLEKKYYTVTAYQQKHSITLEFWSEPFHHYHSVPEQTVILQNNSTLKQSKKKLGN